MTRALAFGAEDRAFTYDALNRLTRETWTVTGANVGTFFYTGHFIAYVYDAHSRRIETADRTGAVTRFAYDTDDRLLQVTLPNGRVIDVENDVALKARLRHDRPARALPLVNRSGVNPPIDFQG